jgi:hypothetical protein
MYARDATEVSPVAQPLRPPVAQPHPGRARLIAGAAVLLALAAGCRSRVRPPGDAGADQDVAGNVCTAATVCDGDAVWACRDGQLAMKLEDCASPQVCSRGRCTSDACKMIEDQPASFLGCLFYALQVDNIRDESLQHTSVLVTTRDDAMGAMVQLQKRTGGMWQTVLAQTAPAGQSTRLVLPGELYPGPSLGVAGSYRVVSDYPVGVTQIQSDDADETSTNSAGTMLLPVAALGQRYMAIAYPQARGQKLASIAGARGGAGQVVIVGTQDDTHLTFQGTRSVSLDPVGGTPRSDAGTPFQITLADGDFYEVFTIADGDDLTGSEITADHPVAVFSGNIATTYGLAAAGINTPDMAQEQLLPETAWGVSYVAAALPPQVGVCDGLLGTPGASLWHVVAAHDGTVVRFDAPPGVTGVPPASQTVTLNQGQVHELVSAGGSFTVTASHPVQVMQGMDCEPSLSSAVAAVPLLKDLRFAALPNFEQVIAVVRHPRTLIQLDSKVIPDGAFHPAGGDFEVAQITLDPCAGAVCTHHLEGMNGDLNGDFGMTMRGMDVVCSYALTVPTWVYCIDDTTPGCVP